MYSVHSTSDIAAVCSKSRTGSALLIFHNMYTFRPYLKALGFQKRIRRTMSAEFVSLWSCCIFMPFIFHWGLAYPSLFWYKTYKSHTCLERHE